tara:strand:+ start:573 stop:1673 length:1101 start_codon:yes stop_codon:yes gene_type:complete
MDTTDIKIKFDENGVCDHCLGFKKNIIPNWHVGKEGKEKLLRQVKKIKKSGNNKEFDSIIGLSGGLDSSYLLHIMVTEYNLKPLVFHVDGGWNTDIAVNNIQMLVDKLGLDLYTEVINWEEMKDLQLSFFKSGVPHLDIPQDHAFIATLYHFANKYNIKYILNGGNYSTESVRNPLEWLYYGSDLKQLKDIHNRFGKRPLNTFPLSSIYFHKIYLRYIKRIKLIKPLNSINYIKDKAKEELIKKYNWVPYPQKHFESRFTRFFEGYWLPSRFGYDTRLTQFSSLILSNQMTREEAIKMLKKPSYDISKLDEDFEYISNKLDISTKELWKYHSMELKSYKDYRNQLNIFNLGANTLNKLGIERAIKR